MFSPSKVLIEKHNVNAKQGLSSFLLGHNEYSDLTHAEFRERMKLGDSNAPHAVETKEFKFLGDSNRSSSSFLRGPSSVEMPAAIGRKLARHDDDDDKVDWQEEGLLGPVRNQGICGACYAFAAIGAIESAMAIEKYAKLTPDEREKVRLSKLGMVVPLSEQDLIDCDTKFENGCEGGL